MLTLPLKSTGMPKEMTVFWKVSRDFFARLIVPTFVATGLVTGPAQAQEDPPELSIGRLVEVRGSLDASGCFVAEKVELLSPGSDESLVGTVPADQVDPRHFTLLGQPVETNESTRWNGLEPAIVAGKRVKVQGRWHDAHRFEVHEITARNEGRDRIGGRVDALVRADGGWRAQIMSFNVCAAEGLEIERIAAASDSSSDPSGATVDRFQRDEDDVFGKGIRLAENLRLSGQIKGKSDAEENFDLQDSANADRIDHEAELRTRLTWTPSDSIAVVSELRSSQRWRDDQEDGQSTDGVTTLAEGWLLWRDVLGYSGFETAIGRQDFDDPREWIYDQNLDALRVAWARPDWRLDLSTSTTLSDGDGRDEAATNWIAYLSNNNLKKHLAIWSIYRDIKAFDPSGDPIPSEKNWHLGVTAVGRWLPQNKSWFEFAYLSGERGTTSVGAWGFDVGTTWSPRAIRPVYFTLGYALGTGEATPGNKDGTFRQTGLQDNTARFGGVTTFQYYGELLDPELSNLEIITAGVGALVAKRFSIDLVYHRYQQDEANDEFSMEPNVEANLDQEPNGISDDLGSEFDLIVGYRRYANWDIELVAAWFAPGDAFDDQDDAYLATLQLRYRF